MAETHTGRCSSPMPLVVVIAFLAGLAALPGTALAGGSGEPPAPPTTSPPGPWDGDKPGGPAPYRPGNSRRCPTAAVRNAGPGSIMGVFTVRASCAGAGRLVRVYQRCLTTVRGRERGCYRRIYKRCLRKVFLGGCRTSDRVFERFAGGYRCTERRLYPIGDRYEAKVDCVKGRKRVSHSYTLFDGAPVTVGTEAELRSAWTNPRQTTIELAGDIDLRACALGEPKRESSTAVTLHGHGHVLTQGCFEKRLLRQDGTGFVVLDGVTLTRGGTDGPGAAVTTRGEIMLVDSKVEENLSEEPGGGVMSQRRATIVRSRITGNLANDDGGGVYARRGGVQVYDSVISNNLVDGSGGAIGSTGDILVVRSHVDGNTTDGDGGAIYADEDGDVTVIDSTVDGSTADGPGGAIFTLDGDVTVVGSTVNGNRADDRGGAISGEADVAIVNSTIARNAAVAHVGGGVWARDDLYVANSTISNNYAEGQGGGIAAGGDVALVHTTILDNQSPVAANIGAGGRLDAFASIIGPAQTQPGGAPGHPTDVNCMPAGGARSFGWNFVFDHSCGLGAPTDMTATGDPMLAPLHQNGGLGETRAPVPGSPVVDRLPADACRFAGLADPVAGNPKAAGLLADAATREAHDQRGAVRPMGAGCDIGAVELDR